MNTSFALALIIPNKLSKSIVHSNDSLQLERIHLSQVLQVLLVIFYFVLVTYLQIII